MKRSTERGFTLLEVMVALMIFATLATALLSAMQYVARASGSLSEQRLAAWVADNRMAELRVQPSSLALGRQQQQVSFGGSQWQVTTQVSAAPNPGLRKVVVEIASQAAIEASGHRPHGYRLVSFIEVPK